MLANFNIELKPLVIWIDGYLVSTFVGYTILQSCLNANIDIPRFCYHDKLSIAGNCRMCLVEVSNSKKLVASCAVPVTDSLKIFTNNLRVKKAREAVLEFLLINHPLDCPICDQGGECDLQDITITFGSDRSRFYEIQKRAVEDKDCGPLVKTVMTRCIHCSRCVRFLHEVSGFDNFGMTGRGERVEIGGYVLVNLLDELSGNIIDLCPVGALTSKPYAFTARSWELKSQEGIDILDSVGSNVKIEVYGNRVMRILPRLNDYLNEDWLTNKARFVYDGFGIQRLNRPLFKSSFILNVLKNANFYKLEQFDWNYFIPSSWLHLLYVLFNVLKEFSTSFYFGELLDFETLFLYKVYANKLGVSKFYTPFIFNNADFRSFYFTSCLLKELEKLNSFFFIGLNLRLEAPLVNSRVRKSYSFYLNEFKAYSLGLGFDYHTYPIKNFANSSWNLALIKLGKHKLSNLLSATSYKFVIFLNNLKISNFFNGLTSSIFPIFQFPSYINLLELGILGRNANNYNSDVNFLIGYDKVNISKSITNIYQGHHGDIGASLSHFILPSSIYVEKSSSYYNLEGRLQSTNRIISSSKLIKEDWKIALVFIIFLNKSVHTNNFNNFKIIGYNKNITIKMDSIRDYIFFNFPKYFSNNALLVNCIQSLLYNYLFHHIIVDYYSSDIISRASKTMSLCSAFLLKKNYTF